MVPQLKVKVNSCINFNIFEAHLSTFLFQNKVLFSLLVKLFNSQITYIFKPDSCWFTT